MGIVSAIGLYILVSIFSSGTESNARWKILIIAVGAGVGQAVILGALPNITGLLRAVVVSVVLIIAALAHWCGVERKPALKIAGSYFGLCVVLGIVTSLPQTKVAHPFVRTAGGSQSVLAPSGTAKSKQ